GLYRPDFSTDPDLYNERAIFVHEMTHVWQYQQGMNVKTRRIFGEWNYDYEKYDKSKFGSKPFRSYGIEQQGKIVEDYYILRSGFPIFEWDDKFQVLNPPPLSTYRNVLRTDFPGLQ